MLKWLIYILLAYVVYRVWQQRKPHGPNTDSSRAQARGVERMVACAHCGVHLPEGESLDDDDDQAYCSEEHRRLGPRKNG